MEAEKERKHQPLDESPPFGEWAHWYLAVLLTLTFLIVLFYAFTIAFS